MLSKEEEYTLANLREHCIKTMQFSNRNSNAYKEHELILLTIDDNISLKYELEQLETDKQNLIKEIETALDFAKTNDDIISKTQVACLQNILKIAKGEKDE